MVDDRRVSRAGSVEGYTPATFAAYYIVWTLVRNMNIVFTPFGWEERIREGQLSGQLVRPVHPIHYDLGYFAGWKVVVIVLWLPIAAVLTLLFHPELDPSAAADRRVLRGHLGRVPDPIVDACGCSGMVTFWTTRVGAIFEAVLRGRAAAVGPAGAAAADARLGADAGARTCRSSVTSASRSPRSSGRSRTPS